MNTYDALTFAIRELRADAEHYERPDVNPGDTAYTDAADALTRLRDALPSEEAARFAVQAITYQNQVGGGLIGWGNSLAEISDYADLRALDA